MARARPYNTPAPRLRAPVAGMSAVDRGRRPSMVALGLDPLTPLGFDQVWNDPRNHSLDHHGPDSVVARDTQGNPSRKSVFHKRYNTNAKVRDLAYQQYLHPHTGTIERDVYDDPENFIYESTHTNAAGNPVNVGRQTHYPQGYAQDLQTPDTKLIMPVDTGLPTNAYTNSFYPLMKEGGHISRKRILQLLRSIYP